MVNLLHMGCYYKTNLSSMLNILFVFLLISFKVFVHIFSCKIAHTDWAAFIENLLSEPTCVV